MVGASEVLATSIIESELRLVGFFLVFGFWFLVFFFFFPSLLSRSSTSRTVQTKGRVQR